MFKELLVTCDVFTVSHTKMTKLIFLCVSTVIYLSVYNLRPKEALVMFLQNDKSDKIAEG